VKAVQHWWLQRLTSVALVPLTVWFVVSVLSLPSLDRPTVITWMSGTWTALLLIAFVVVGAWHSRLGIQVIIEDYVHGAGNKALALALSAFVHIAVAAVGAFAVLRIALGGAA